MTMKTIHLSQNKKTKVDDNDYQKLSQFRWYYNGRYAARSGRKGGKKVNVYMHREILACPKSKVIDHISGDSLDNRKVNLRCCTHAENFRNQGISKHNTSGAKGVVWNKRNKNWNARITVDRKRIHLGCFNDKVTAIKQYNLAAKKYHEQYARINKNEEEDEAIKANETSASDGATDSK